MVHLIKFVMIDLRLYELVKTFVFTGGLKYTRDKFIGRFNLTRYFEGIYLLPLAGILRKGKGRAQKGSP